MSVTLLFVYLALSSLFLGRVEDPPVMTLTYRHGIKLDSIHVPGVPFMFKQLCTTRIDSVISSGNVIFKESRIGKIRSCDFQWQIRNDTLDAIVIETFKERNTDQVVKQLTSQFGSPVETGETATTVYTWSRKLAVSEVKAVLVVDKKEGTGVLTVRNQK